MSRLLSAAVGAHRSYCLADILLPSREAIASVFVTRSECQSFLATCQLLAHIGHVADGLLLQHVLVIVKHPVDGLIARHPEQQEGDRLLLLDPHPTHIGATQSVAWCDVLDAQPTSEQWALVEAEACNRALRGQAPPLTLQQLYDTVRRLCLLQHVTELLQQVFSKLSGQGSCAELDEQWPAIAAGLRRWDEEAARKLAARGGGRFQQANVQAMAPGSDPHALEQEQQQQQPPCQLQGEELQQGDQRATGASSGVAPEQGEGSVEQRIAPRGHREGERGQWQEREAQPEVHAEMFVAGQGALAAGGSSPPPASRGGAACGTATAAAADGGGDGDDGWEVPCPPVGSKAAGEESRPGSQGGDSGLQHSSPQPQLSPKSDTPEAAALIVRCAGPGRHGQAEPGRGVGCKVADKGQPDGCTAGGGDGAGLPGGSGQAVARRREKEQQHQQHEDRPRCGGVTGRELEDVGRKRPRDQQGQEGGELHGPGEERKRGREREQERERRLELEQEREKKRGRERRLEREGRRERGRERSPPERGGEWERVHDPERVRERVRERERERERGLEREPAQGRERSEGGVRKEAGRSPVRDRDRDRERDGSGGGDRRERQRSPPPRNSGSRSMQEDVEQWTKELHAWLLKQPSGQATSQEMISAGFGVPDWFLKLPCGTRMSVSTFMHKFERLWTVLGSRPLLLKAVRDLAAGPAPGDGRRGTQIGGSKSRSRGRGGSNRSRSRGRGEPDRHRARSRGSPSRDRRRSRGRGEGEEARKDGDRDRVGDKGRDRSRSRSRSLGREVKGQRERSRDRAGRYRSRSRSPEGREAKGGAERLSHGRRRVEAKQAAGGQAGGRMASHHRDSGSGSAPSSCPGAQGPGAGAGPGPADGGGAGNGFDGGGGGASEGSYAEGQWAGAAGIAVMGLAPAVRARGDQGGAEAAPKRAAAPPCPGQGHVDVGRGGGVGPSAVPESRGRPVLPGGCERCGASGSEGSGLAAGAGSPGGGSGLGTGSAEAATAGQQAWEQVQVNAKEGQAQAGQGEGEAKEDHTDEDEEHEEVLFYVQELPAKLLDGGGQRGSEGQGAVEQDVGTPDSLQQHPGCGQPRAATGVRAEVEGREAAVNVGGVKEMELGRTGAGTATTSGTRSREQHAQGAARELRAGQGKGTAGDQQQQKEKRTGGEEELQSGVQGPGRTVVRGEAAGWAARAGHREQRKREQRQAWGDKQHQEEAQRSFRLGSHGFSEEGEEEEGEILASDGEGGTGDHQWQREQQREQEPGGGRSGEAPGARDAPREFGTVGEYAAALHAYLMSCPEQTARLGDLWSVGLDIPDRFLAGDRATRFLQRPEFRHLWALLPRDSGVSGSARVRGLLQPVYILHQLESEGQYVRRLYAYLLSRLPESVTVTQLYRLGLAVPDHLLRTSHDAFFKTHSQHWYISRGEPLTLTAKR